jgi:hypothetical protein
VAPANRKRLVATFNGGFPLETSNAGLIYRGRSSKRWSTALRLLSSTATVASTSPAGIKDRTRPPDIWLAKQSLPPIISKGPRNPNLSDGPEWEKTPTPSASGSCGRTRAAGALVGARRPIRRPSSRTS